MFISEICSQTEGAPTVTAPDTTPVALETSKINESPSSLNSVNELTESQQSSLGAQFFTYNSNFTVICLSNGFIKVFCFILFSFALYTFFFFLYPRKLFRS